MRRPVAAASATASTVAAAILETFATLDYADPADLQQSEFGQVAWVKIHAFEGDPKHFLYFKCLPGDSCRLGILIKPEMNRIDVFNAVLLVLQTHGGRNPVTDTGPLRHSLQRPFVQVLQETITWNKFAARSGLTSRGMGLNGWGMFNREVGLTPLQE